jgi:DNA polymerase/3'-5' exonuclease PolX
MIPFKQAKHIADGIEAKLQPFTNLINIAGSIRREKHEVKDIEIVCLPQYVDFVHSDLFGAKTVERAVSENFAGVIKSLGKVIKGNPDGRYMQIELPQRINLDLFMPDPVDYFRQFAIRTGSADYAHRTIATGWLKKGWCGSDIGLRRISDCIEHKQPDGKSKWECVNRDGERPPIWKSEPEFFDWIGVPWIMPKLRTI